MAYGILSIGYFMLLINYHLALFQLPSIGQQPKNVLSISLETRNFLFILSKKIGKKCKISNLNKQNCSRQKMSISKLISRLPNFTLVGLFKIRYPGLIVLFFQTIHTIQCFYLKAKGFRADRV
jgi:hypothetical protein